MVVLVGILKLWNKFSLTYNHKILQNSKCMNCDEVLGTEALRTAIVELQKEKEQLKQETKVATVKLHNMRLICPNCQTENFERDLYKANRANRKK